MDDRWRHEENRLSWNHATIAHNSHKGDQAAYYRAGGNKLYREDLELLGDITNLDVVHLQCNAGQDTLSLVQLGARLTGVDISDTAIDFARRLAAEAGLAATFECADVYDWLAAAANKPERYDVVYSSYGALCWLSDLAAWARGVTAILKPGGRLVVVDYHPVAGMYDEQLGRVYPYFSDGIPLRSEEGVYDYVAATGVTVTGYEEGMVDFKNPYPVNEWFWGVGEIVTAVLDAGLSLELLREYPYANGWKMYDTMHQQGDDRWYLPDDQPAMPLMYGMVARRAR